MILSLFTLGTYISTNKVIQWETEKKEQPCLIVGKGRNNLNTRMQLDKGTYILTGQILNQNFQESQKRMQRHICYDQMTGWKHTILMKI